MPVFKTNILNKEIKINYKIEERHRLEKAVNNINEDLKKFRNLNGKISDTKILSLYAIELQDKIQENLKNKNLNKEFEDKYKLIQKNNLDLSDQNQILRKKIQQLEIDKFKNDEEIENIKKNIQNIINLINNSYNE